MGVSAFCAAPISMARSCPRPINMQPRRQPSFQPDDDLAGFVPPHELVACSLMDTSNVTVSSAQKCGWLQAAQCRSVVLGFAAQHANVLPYGADTAGKQSTATHRCIK
jgi:hypothetical protein